MHLRTSVTAIATLLAMSLPGSAQNNDVVPPPANCQATPRTDAQEQQPRDVDPLTTQSLTDKLDACNGVLKPPAIGDQELTQPPPDTGEMREIKPRDLPGQQPSPQPQ